VLPTELQESMLVRSASVAGCNTLAARPTDPMAVGRAPDPLIRPDEGDAASAAPADVTPHVAPTVWRDLEPSYAVVNVEPDVWLLKCSFVVRLQHHVLVNLEK
jgi:hypothetical protein